MEPGAKLLFRFTFNWQVSHFQVLSRRWIGPRITFGFSQCPICKADMAHDVIEDLLSPIGLLFDDVKRKALMRLEYEGLDKCEAITSKG